MARELKDSVVVVVGASSGIGRAAAVAFADAGAHVVVAARSVEPLDRVAAEVRARRVHALVVPTDIGDAEQVDRLVAAAVDRFGRIDTVVVTAAVLSAAVFGDEPLAEVEAALRTNVTGTVLCARAALAQFRRQGSGVLITTSSILGVAPAPLLPVYALSKYAVRGLSLSLRELARRWPDIHVCVVLPGPVDTPIWQRSANYTGRRLRAAGPAAAPERVAAAIVSCARVPRRQVPVGAIARLILAGLRLAPRATEWAVARSASALMLTGDPEPAHGGAVHHAGAEGHVHGGWRHGSLRRRVGEVAGRVGYR